MLLSPALTEQPCSISVERTVSAMRLKEEGPLKDDELMQTENSTHGKV